MEEFATPAKDKDDDDDDNNNDETPPDLQTPSDDNGETLHFHDRLLHSDEFDSACSTPYVSAPSSPGRCGITGGGGGGFFYSAPASPMHFISSMTASSSTSTTATSTSTIAASGSFEFEFSSRHAVAGGWASTGTMSSADELFLDGKIRPMKLSMHLQRPQVLAPLLDLDENGEDEDDFVRGRDLKLRSRSIRRRTRSMSPLRTTSFQWLEDDECDDVEGQGDRKSTEANVPDLASKNAQMIAEAGSASTDTTPSASSSRSSSVGRNSKRWVFLKEFLYRSKSEGRNNGHKFWSTLSFSPVKDKKMPAQHAAAEKAPDSSAEKAGKQQQVRSKKVVGNGVGNRGRRVGLSAHELHYTANRAQAEEMRKKTFLPYRQGLLGCLGFGSKSYGAMNGFARALNPVSSR